MQLQQHVADLHADGDIGFSKEYEAIQAASAQDHHPAEHSQHPDNKQKNRYLNIVACKLSSCTIILFIINIITLIVSM